MSARYYDIQERMDDLEVKLDDILAQLQLSTTATTTISRAISRSVPRSISRAISRTNGHRHCEIKKHR